MAQSNPLLQLGQHGQSVWLDYISRELLNRGDLENLIATSNVTGLTSNPTIFQKAIAEGGDYDAQIWEALDAGATDPDSLFFELAISDIQRACDSLRPVFEQTHGADGYASLEVSPHIATDTSTTIAMVHDLWSRIERPNAMIKIPATPEGMPAIERCLTDGININITLIFALSAYDNVINAYLRAMEARLAAGQHLDVHSVASFFVSRVDTAVDPLLAAQGNTELQGRAAIANARLAYELFEQYFVSGERFAKLRDAGAPLQRPLWASTSAKNPNYRDVVYAEALIGPDTVDTMPPPTISAFRDHGVVSSDTVKSDPAETHRVMEQLKAAGIDMDQVLADLLAAGVASFTTSYDELTAGLNRKVDRLRGAKLRPVPGPSEWQVSRQYFAYGEQHTIAQPLGTQASTVARQIWKRDADLWKPGDAQHAAIIHNRLGWLDVIDTMRGELPRLQQLSADLTREGYRDVVLLGMGGSSLCAEVLRTAFESPQGAPTLHVLDTTDPAAIKDLGDNLDLKRTLFIVASKSGGTIETMAHLAHFCSMVDGDGSHFVAITDAGSPLAELAKSYGFRDIFLNPADIGGRYSALSFFGLVPAACAGLDVAKLLDRAAEMRSLCAADMPADINCGLFLGTVLAQLAASGRDKVTILASPKIAAFGLWAEQLISESTGKDGKGIIPVGLEPVGHASDYGNDRFFVVLRVGDASDFDDAVAELRQSGQPVLTYQLSDVYDLAAEFFRWEFAVAVAGAALGVDPFDEPNVTESKDNTSAVLAGFAKNGSLPTEPPVAQDGAVTSYGGTLAKLLDEVAVGDYVALMAYVTPNAKNEAALQALRLAIRDTHRVATTLGFGPRFLHSTGQLHKGGPNTGVFVQITADDPVDITIPDRGFGFGTLKAAQAAGDLASLHRHNRRVIRLHISGDMTTALTPLTERVHATARGYAPMQLGFVGLGRMGANMVARLRTNGSHDVIGFDPDASARVEIGKFGATAVDSLPALVSRLTVPRCVWIMVPEKVIEATAADLIQLLDAGDTIIDGGNTNYRDTQRRTTIAAGKGIGYVDAGTSGGIWGREEGYCLMVGGDRAVVERYRPIFETLAPKDGFLHVGPAGAGNFVKMIHNGIEYGMLQAYAEGFALLNAKHDFGDFDLKAIAHLWNQGSVVRSWLLELSEKAFASDPHLAKLHGFVDDTGEGSWTVAEANDLDVPAPVIALSLMARQASRLPDAFSNKFVAALRHEFGGHPVKS